MLLVIHPATFTSGVGIYVRGGLTRIGIFPGALVNSRLDVLTYLTSWPRWRACGPAYRGRFTRNIEAPDDKRVPIIVKTPLQPFGDSRTESLDLEGREQEALHVSIFSEAVSPFEDAAPVPDQPFFDIHEPLEETEPAWFSAYQEEFQLEDFVVLDQVFFEYLETFEELFLDTDEPTFLVEEDPIPFSLEVLVAEEVDTIFSYLDEASLNEEIPVEPAVPVEESYEAEQELQEFVFAASYQAEFQFEDFVAPAVTTTWRPVWRPRRR